MQHLMWEQSQHAVVAHSKTMFHDDGTLPILTRCFDWGTLAHAGSGVVADFVCFTHANGDMGLPPSGTLFWAAVHIVWRSISHYGRRLCAECV